MKIEQDARFREQRERYQLRFCCESCANFDAPVERCSLEFPVEEHRLVHYRDPEALLVFCKDYEFR